LERVDTQLSDDQLALETSCQGLLEKEWPLAQALKTLGPGGSGHSAQLWQTLVESGWLGLPFAAQWGGAGGDLIDLGLVYRAAGERLVPSTFYSCSFAQLLLDRLSSATQKKTWLAPAIAGRLLATVAYTEPHAAQEARLFKTTATRNATGWTLQGVKAFVPNVETAGVLLILAKTQSNVERGQFGVFAITRDSLGQAVRRHSALGGDALHRVELNALQVAADALLGGEAALPTTLEQFSDVVEQATALQCMEMLGGVAAVLKRTVEYVREREQHGRALGSFQAVQHLLANVSIQLDGARVAALQALFLKSQGRPAAREVSIAKIAAGELYASATTIAHQLWGAMGYARETGLYLWSERAKVADATFGTSSYHLSRLAGLMGL
jgi:alkylation response protein AidB-like acyl-CoA dehydrogenase